MISSFEFRRYGTNEKFQCRRREVLRIMESSSASRPIVFQMTTGSGRRLLAVAEAESSIEW